jgi:hypothetical protein
MAAATEAFLEQRRDEASDVSSMAQGIIPEQVAPPAAAAGGTGKLSPDLVGFVLALKREVPTIDHLDELATMFPPEWIEKRRQEHQERVALYNRIDDDMELYQDKIRRELSEHGYVKVKQVDDEWLARFNKLEARAKERFAMSKKIEFNDSDFKD